MDYLTESDERTRLFGEALATALRAGDAVLLRGDLGAGKSVLARGIARGLGVDEPMPSPTFMLMLPYEGKDCPVYHFDLYRLEDMEEFCAAGLDEMIDGDGVCLIEWPLEGLNPCRCMEIHIQRAEDAAQRIIRLDASRFGREIGETLGQWEVSL